ncbi:PREDICTED: uncharacterized protein LOC109350524 [Lupinus angustifolius]|uniref:uncharacterized protein LOC109350524 n=1 Tax=Lupinus angustifolius TaxID=3871 RepID=UPI00092EEE54|nr:PREDICTED: uncharacterized protein LOC109350524 [Lupinus angustifolius]
MVALAMKIGALDLTQKLFHFNLISTIPFQRTILFFHQPFLMAEAAPSNTTPAPHPIQPDNKDIPIKQIPPPPPEKPDPFDCCGSGCVRCVWDVYYDELDQYDKLYKQDNNNTES